MEKKENKTKVFINNNTTSIVIPKKTRLPSGKLILSLLSVVFIFSLVANMASIARGSESHYTFRYFLETLQSFNPLPFDLNSIPNLTITANWGVFDFLRVFINNLSVAWSMLVYIVTCVENVLLFLLHFVTRYFVF